MNNEQYIEVLDKNIEAVNEGKSPEHLMPLLQWLRYWRPAEDAEENIDYMTSADIQANLADLVHIDLNEISTIMWRLGYQVSVASIYPSWGMLATDY